MDGRWQQRGKRRWLRAGVFCCLWDCDLAGCGNASQATNARREEWARQRQRRATVGEAATAWAAGDDAGTDADGHGQDGGADDDDATAAGADASDAPPLVSSRAQPGGRLRATGGAAVMATAHHIPSCPSSLSPPLPQASKWADGQGDAQNAAGG
ncbi:hypothetical protein GGP41_005042 [Bipolaris sorokiniana]|uniref:Uncharacterized protein n=1 Tax=Cochliobolus sativus TaxID=45130 RepID=A0A8H6DVN0_COCSA|nr:hypothetical protein GGP41_005042 [Bipolaris sorokiniana]